MLSDKATASLFLHPLKKDISVAHQERNSANDPRYEAISCALNSNDVSRK